MLPDRADGRLSRIGLTELNNGGLVEAVLEPPEMRAQSASPRDAPTPRISPEAILRTVPDDCPNGSSSVSHFAFGKGGYVSVLHVYLRPAVRYFSPFGLPAF